jgi:DNA-binding MarR family transcriptional regulator
MAQHGLTDAQWKPLWILHMGSASTALELARVLDMDAGAVSRLLDRLEAKGLVARDRSVADRRVVHLRLTSAGRDVAAAVPHVLASVNNDFLHGMSHAEWQQLLALLDRMVANGQALPAASEAA